MRVIYILSLACASITILPAQSIKVLLDTDANNELDDQHAIAYMLFNAQVFDIKGITVNATYNGGGIEEHLEEARRVVALCGDPDIPVIAGASKDFKEILPHIDGEFDGQEAVDFIIKSAYQQEDEKLVIVPIGTLTNVALAVAKDPSIAPMIRVVWLGSNWPKSGEYNLVNDTTAINSLINNRSLELEICTVRYGEPTGTSAVSVSVEEIRKTMKGLGPKIETSIEGRHGNEFNCFGDYSIELFEKIGDQERALFDVCALAILKNPTWADPTKVPAPRLQGESWYARPENTHHIIFWENFDKEAILQDFYDSMKRPHLLQDYK